MKRQLSVLTVLFFCSLGSPGVLPAQPLLGFTDAEASRQRALETQFDSLLQKENFRTWMQHLSSHAHHIGSPYGERTARYVDSLFRTWGYQSSIETFYVLFPTPKQRILEMTAPGRYTASLIEPAIAEDVTSGLTSEELPLYNAYSADGDVTGELVYVNYGIPDDYEELDRRGISVKGRIVIARYGGSWRGIKPKVAAEKGAIGCIIYSDPRDDGYFQGDTYPGGSFRNDRSGQRGSVLDMPLYSGDPLTPFVGATKNAKRLSLDSARTLAKIPVLPISYADALPLLRALEGPVAPESWRGALPITYHCGPGPAVVHLEVKFSWDIVPIHDVIAMMPGEEYPDEWVIRGNHHDAWVFGAEDPVSGLVGMMEEARVIGQLAKRGLKPKRSIVYCAWDGEEEGLLGSTEWVETHAEELRRKAVVYLNSDGYGRGFLGAAGSHTLERFVNQVARDVVDPSYSISVADRLRAQRIATGPAEDLKELRELGDIPIGSLGSGSDYTPFIQHLGIAALNIGYGGEGEGGSYHSIYDSFDYYTRFIDPGFTYGVTFAQTTGRATLRLANAPVLPFEFSRFSATIGQFLREVSKLTETMREETEETNRRIREHTLRWAADPTGVLVLPSPKAPVPYLNFAPLQNACAKLDESATALEKTRAEGQVHVRDAKELNRALMNFEHLLTLPAGLPGRPWYVHQIYAPGQYTGYGVKTLPAVREAIELRQWSLANEQILVVADLLERYAAEIDRIGTLVRK